jgi:AbiV family abortive infection protein
MKQSSQPQSLSIEEIALAMAACITNAGELIDESDLLARANHRARAYFLYHAACEELAKFFMFDIAGRRVVHGDSPNWRRFWQRLRNHDSKLAQIEVRNRFAPSPAPDESQELIEAGLQLLFTYGTLPRNTSLYVELGPSGTFRKPSDIDWELGLPAIKAIALRLDHIAKQIGISVDSIKAALQQPPTEKTLDHPRAASRVRFHGV